MIQKFEIEIPEWGILDTYEDIDVSFTYEFINIEELNSRVSKYSKTLTLPGTPNNNKFFKYIGEIQSQSNYDIKKKIKCNVRIGDNNIFSGLLELKNIIKTLESDDYEINITSTDKNFFEDIGEHSLNTLDVSRYTHKRNKDNIINSWDTSIIINGEEKPFQLGRGYVYPRILYGNNTNPDKWFTYDAFPAFYVKTILDIIFEKYGYSYKSNFFESEYFKKLIIPYGKSQISLSDTEIGRRTTKVGIPSADSPTVLDPLLILPETSDYYSTNKFINIDDSSTLDFTDYYGQWDSVNTEWTCNKQGIYDISFNGILRWKYTNPSGLDMYWLGGNGMRHIYRMYLTRANGTTTLIADSGISPSNPYGEVISSPSDNATHPSPWYDTGASINMTLYKSGLHLDPGDRIWFEFKGKMEQVNSWFEDGGGSTDIILTQPVLYRELDNSYTYFEAKPSNNISMGEEEINMTQILPDMSIKDFIKNIILMFNLYVTTDGNSLIIEPINEYLDTTLATYDWSDLLDRDSDIELTPSTDEIKRIYKYEYESDDDVFNKRYKDEFQETYGTGEYILNLNEKESEEIKLSFASTPDSSHLDWESTIMPWFVNIDDNNQITPKNVTPRILFYGGLITGSYIDLVDETYDSSPLSINVYPYCGHWDHPLTPTYDLNFQTSKRIYWYSESYPENNLFNQYHRRYLNNILNGTILKGQFKLSPDIINKLDIRNKIQIDGVDFRLLSVNDYNPISYDRTTEVYLLKIIDDENYYESQGNLPVSFPSCPSDIRVDKKGKYYSPSGQTITEECCNSLGGSYDGGVCSVKHNGDVLPKDPKGTGNGKPDIPIDNGNTSKIGVNIEGSNNTVSNGTINTIILGDNNGISNYTPTLNVGNSNDIQGNNISVFGDDNTIINNVSGSFIVGSGNTFITSSVSSSVTSSIVNVVVLGVDNLVMSSSYTAYLPTNLILSGSDANINGIDLDSLLSSSLGWPGVLSIDNETGPNNPLITTGSYIGSTTNPGNGKILFSDNDPNDVNIRSTDTTSSSNFVVDPYSVYLDSTQFKVNLNAFLTDNNTVTPITSYAGDCNSTFITTNNSTIGSGIVNSIVIGGSDHNIITGSNDSGIFVGELNTIDNAPWSVIIGGYQSIIQNCNWESCIINSELSSIVGCDYATVLSSYNSNILNFSGYSVIAGGSNNTLNDANHSIINGGSNNSITSSTRASILSGQSNTITNGGYSSILAGLSNIITSSIESSIVGGQSNIIQTNSDDSAIIAGNTNTIAESIVSSIVGGQSNIIQTNSEYSSILAGLSNIITSSIESSIVGGQSNIIQTNSDDSAIIAGNTNIINNSVLSIIAGGQSNNIDNSQNAVILTGDSNIIQTSSSYSGILGGQSNTITDSKYSAIISGKGNVINKANYSSIIGSFNLDASNDNYTQTLYNQDNYHDAFHTVTTTNNTATTVYQFTPSDGVYHVETDITAFETATGDALGAKCFAVFKVIAGVVTQIGTITLDRKSIFPATVTTTIDTDNTVIRIRVTGRTGSTIDWRSHLKITK